MLPGKGLEKGKLGLARCRRASSCTACASCAACGVVSMGLPSSSPAARAEVSASIADHILAISGETSGDECCCCDAELSWPRILRRLGAMLDEGGRGGGFGGGDSDCAPAAHGSCEWRFCHTCRRMQRGFSRPAFYMRMPAAAPPAPRPHAHVGPCRRAPAMRSRSCTCPTSQSCASNRHSTLGRSSARRALLVISFACSFVRLSQQSGGGGPMPAAPTVYPKTPSRHMGACVQAGVMGRGIGRAKGRWAANSAE